MKTNVVFVTGAFVALLAFPASAQFYKQTNIVSDLPSMNPQLVDPNLVNSWGVSHGPGTPFWVSDAGTSKSSLYSVNPTTGAVSQPAALMFINVPLPTGQVFNGVSTDFLIAGNHSIFIFASLNGNIYGWTGGGTGSSAMVGATGTPPSVYTGLAMATFSGNQTLYAANPRQGRIDVFDHNFVNITVGFPFHDPALPSGLVPFNIANIGGNLFVSYAAGNPAAVALGVIDVYHTDGTLVGRFATGNATTLPMYNPWGMTLAPASFGEFSNALLVGNFNLGNSAAAPGYILAFDPNTKAFLGMLKGTDSNPLKIDGLWQLIFGGGGNDGNPDNLYFAAGIQNQMHGLFASLTTCTGPIISGAAASPNVLWPPNNKFVTVSVPYTVTDNCDAAPACTLSVTAADSGGGINNQGDSSIVLDAHTVQLLASRNGGGNGRIYTIDISCKDKLPLSSSTNVTVTVPHDQGH